MTSSAGCTNSRPRASTYVTPVARLREESRLTRKTVDRVRTSKFGLLCASGMTVKCGLALAFTSHP